MSRFTANFEEFDAPWSAFDVSGSSTNLDYSTWPSYANPPDAAPLTSMAGLDGSYISFDDNLFSQSHGSSMDFDYPTWPSYSNPPDAAPSTSMAGLDGSCVSFDEYDYPFSQSHQLESFDLSTFPQPSDVSQEALYSACSNPECQQCLKTIWASAGVPFEATAGEGSESLNQPQDPSQLMATPFLPQVPPATPSISLSTIPTSDTGLGSNAISMEPYWEGGHALPQPAEENWYYDMFLSKDYSSHLSALPMHPSLSVTGSAMPHDHHDHEIPLLSSDHDALGYLAGQMAVVNQGYETSGIFAGVLNQPYGADPSSLYNDSHDSDTTWQSISVPHAGTVALEQLDGSSAGIPKSRPTTPAWTTTPSHSIIPPSIPAPPTPHFSTPSDIIFTAARKCSYIDPDGKACRRSLESVSSRNAARHWFTCHAMKELLRIRAKTLAMSQATIINSTARKLAAERYLGICPRETCIDKGRRRAEFVREDSLIRHMENPRRHKGIAMSRREASRWAHANMEVMSISDEFGSAYEEAVSRIWHGY